MRLFSSRYAGGKISLSSGVKLWVVSSISSFSSSRMRLSEYGLFIVPISQSIETAKNFDKLINESRDGYCLMVSHFVMLELFFRFKITTKSTIVNFHALRKKANTFTDSCWYRWFGILSVDVVLHLKVLLCF